MKFIILHAIKFNELESQKAKMLHLKWVKSYSLITWFSLAIFLKFTGSLSDPGNISGLAHFCEHMLFLGTKKYPKENEYSQFLSEHAGSSNAFTSGEHTNYYFDVSHEHLQGALDRYFPVLLMWLICTCTKSNLSHISCTYEVCPVSLIFLGVLKCIHLCGLGTLLSNLILTTRQPVKFKFIQL